MSASSGTRSETTLRGRSESDAVQGPDPHDMFGCSVPFSLWVGCLFVATLSYYTTDYMRQGQDASEKRTERYVYDPTAGELLELLGGTPGPVQSCCKHSGFSRCKCYSLSKSRHR